MVTPARDTVLQQLSKLADGLEAHMAETPLMIAGVRYTGTSLAATVRTVQAAVQRVADAEAELANAVRDSRRTQASNSKLILGAQGLLRSRFLNDSVTLAEFGLEPARVPAPMSNETKLVRAAKARSTREKRGTMSKKKRLTIKRDVRGVTINPVTGSGKKNG